MTSTTHLALACMILLCASVAAIADDAPAQKGSAKPQAEAAGEQRLSGPYTHENLTIFLVHGPSTLRGDYLTLEEAMAQNKVKVHETSDVNELAIENIGRHPVFIQSGDIVKGGKQDRCIGTDFTLAPDSGKVKIAAFCVERGRWQQRGGESASLFSGSSETLTGRRLKLAGNANYKGGGGQQKVWQEVAAAQQNLGQAVDSPVASPASPSSLQLTLENKDVREAVEKYLTALRDAPAEKDDVIGYAAVINGAVNCADVYGSHQLFRKLWPRSLKSLATEAAAEAKPGQEIAAVSSDAVEAALRSADDGQRSEKIVNDDIRVITIESKRGVSFESRADGEDGYLRRSLLTKDE